MASIDDIEVELTIIVGSAEMSLERLLGLGRGAVIPLGGDGSQPLKIMANGLSVGQGRVLLDGERVNVEVTPADAVYV